MSRADWWGFHAHISTDDTPDALTAALADPDQAWWARRRIGVLVATGALTAASWSENLHPRGKDGKFIEKFGWVRWFDGGDNQWKTGWVEDIEPGTGMLTVRDPKGDKTYFANAKQLYARPKPKARLALPNPLKGTDQKNWKKVGGQGGSNPGGMYEIDGSFAANSPDISAATRLSPTLRAMMQTGSMVHFGDEHPNDPPDAFWAPEVNVVTIPSLDGTAGRYDVLQKVGGNWYRVPANGSMLSDDLMKDDLKVDPNIAFGPPGSARRIQVSKDERTLGIIRSAEFDIDDVAQFVQKQGSPLPQVGDRYYVKTMNIPERARNEALANDFYELLGVPVPDVAVGEDGVTISSKLVGNGTVPFDPSNPAHIKAAQEGFVADAFLANWDVIGLTYDNLQVDQDGRVWRIDAGGALAYRAQGKPKGPMFGETVGELASLQNKSINPQAATVFGGVSFAQLKEQAALLQGITPDQITTLANQHDLADYAPVLIARRKNILDQVGIVDPPPLPEPPPPPAPKVVFNPVEAVNQMGSPPVVGMKNWANAYANVKSYAIESNDWDMPSFTQDVLFKKDGRFYQFSHGLEDLGDGTHRFYAKDVLNGETRRVTVFDGSNEFLDMPPDLEAFTDSLNATRDQAIAEYVARAADIPLGPELDDLSLYKDGDADDFTYAVVGLPNFSTLMEAGDFKRLGPNNDGPLRDANGDLWEITSFPSSQGGTLQVTRRTGIPGSTEGLTLYLDQTTFPQQGPWFMPSNDVTAAVWRSKYNSNAPDDLPDAAQAIGEQAKLYNTLNPPDADADKPDIGQDEGGGYVDPDLDALLNEGSIPGTTIMPDGTVVPTPQYEEAPPLGPVPDWVKTAKVVQSTDPGYGIKTADPELEALLAEEEAIAAAMHQGESSGPGANVKVTNDVVAGLSPSEPLLSTEMDPSDLEALKADLIGKNVVVLPIAAHDNPDWEGKDLGTANGLGKVTDVIVTPGQYIGAGKWADVIKVKIEYGSGGGTWVMGGDGTSKFPKVLIPVAQDPVGHQVTFKGNGDIIVNGEVVGKHTGKGYQPGLGWQYDYTAVIDGDHSLTGKPMHLSGAKLALLKKGVNNALVPIAPKTAKPKSAKALATEQKIKDLNADLASVDAQLEVAQATLADLASAVPEGPTLADGTVAKKGDWVLSTKDGKHMQILNPVVKGFKAKGDVASGVIKLKVEKDGKWIQTNRKIADLVSVPGPGEPAFVLQTKALKAEDGSWFGPGSAVNVKYVGTGKATVIDTTTDGSVKLLHPDGSMGWVPAGYVENVATATKPAVVTPEKTGAAADALNAQIATLNDQKAHLASQIALASAPSPAKAKKPVGTPFPGPGGKTIVQAPVYAEQREAKGLKNTKDGYVPTPGMILRHNDGTQYVVWEMGDEWSSHKNSVRVVPLVDSPGGYGPSVWDAKWRAVSTMVVDHDAMLTDSNGDALPIINEIEGDDGALPSSGIVLSKTFKKSYYVKNPDFTTTYRSKELTQWYVVAEDGKVYNLDGTIANPSAIQPGMPTTKVGYIDKNHGAGGKKLTVSIQPHPQPSIGQVQYAAVHDPDQPAGISIAKAKKQADVANAAKALGVDVPPAPPAPAPEPAVAVTPEAPDLPTPVETPVTADLPVFEGTNPQGMEMPHPPTTSSSKATPAYTIQGGTPTLDVAALPGSKSIVTAIQESIDTTKSNKATGKREWTGNYGLGDHDTIEDMMIRTQTVRDAKGDEYVEVSFRLDKIPRQKAYTTFMTSSKNEIGDWEQAGRNAKNMQPGDMLAVRVASGGGVTPKGALRPDDNANAVPNAQVVAAPVLIGKNQAGTFDVYRTQVVTAGGDVGFIDLEDRSSSTQLLVDSLVISVWEPTKARTSNGAVSLNPNAQAQGWSVKSNSLRWARTQSPQNVSELDSDGAKKLGGTNTVEVGSGYTLQRDHDGVHIEYSTSKDRNTLDGHTIIRVKADDPEAQRKISEAMELVGVSKEAQKPPTREAILAMAADKVYEQFHPTYTAGMKAPSMDQALAAIDNAVGPQLGRKATIDDISIRTSPDGRVQVLVSEDVSRAIVKKNGIATYTHDFTSSGYDALLEQMVGGEQIGLLSTSERWQHGLFYWGMSSAPDHNRDSADHMFLRMSKATTSHGVQVHVDPVVIHRHVDYYYRTGDNYGLRGSDQLNWLNNPVTGGGNELMIQRRLEASLIGRVYLDESTRQKLISNLKKKGITKAPNGMDLEQFFAPSGTSVPFAPPTFGDEIPLGSLPETLPGAVV